MFFAFTLGRNLCWHLSVYLRLNSIISDNIKFGLAIPQGWRGGDLPLEEENSPIKQYEFSKPIAKTVDN